MNGTSVSSISIDLSIQSISIKSDLPDISILIFIDLLLRANWQQQNNFARAAHFFAVVLPGRHAWLTEPLLLGFSTEAYFYLAGLSLLTPSISFSSPPI